MSGDRSKWPPMVRLGLWGISDREMAWGFFWFALGRTAGGIADGASVQS
jgi:hypothetical protein